MKQTAVDWLFNRLWETPKDKFSWHSILEEAKQREKEQIEDAFKTGDFENTKVYSAEDYYKEKYE